MAAATESVPAWVQFCTTLAPAAAWLVFAAPLPTLQQIKKDKATGGLPLLPYSSMVVNCIVWCTYGTLTSNSTVITANTVGLVLGLYYFYTFCQYAKPNATGLPGTVSNHVQGTIGITALTLGMAATLPKETAGEIVGKQGVFFCIVLFGSPLAVLEEVILTKNATNIPLPFTLASTINCLLWSVAGVLNMKDFNIYFPNLMGLSCCIAQLVVIFMYGKGSATIKKSEGVELIPR